MLCCKPQHSLEHNYKLYYGTCLVTVRTVHNSSTDTVILDKTTKHAHSTDVAIPNSHNRHSAITERFQKCAHLKEELTGMCQLKTAYVILIGTIHSAFYPKETTRQFKTA